MSIWKKYPDLEPVKRLRNEGRELLGKVVLFTVKRDGENTSIWFDEDEIPQISSRRMKEADKSIRARLRSTPEYSRAIELLKNELNYDNKFILYGELLKKGRFICKDCRYKW